MATFDDNVGFLEKVIGERNIGLLPVRFALNKEHYASIREAGFGMCTFRGRFLDDSADVAAAIMVVGNSGDDHGALKGFVRTMRRQLGFAAALVRTGGGAAMVLADTSEQPWQRPSCDVLAMVAEFCSEAWGRRCTFDEWDQPQAWFARLADHVRLKHGN